MKNSELIKASESLIKREGEILPFLKVLFFEGLKKKYKTQKIIDVLIDYKNGSWGNDYFHGSIKAKVLRSPDIRFGFIDFQNSRERYFSIDEFRNFQLLNNDILVIKSNGSFDLVGKSQLYKQSQEYPYVVASNFLMVLRPDDNKIFPEYLDLFLKSPEAIVWRYDTQRTTTGLRNLNTKGFLKIALPLPDTTKEQKDIFRSFKEVSEGRFENVDKNFNRYYNIALNKSILHNELIKQINLIPQLRQAFLREAMQGKLVPQDKNDEPASELLKRINVEKEKLIAEGEIKKQKPLPEIEPEEIPYEIPENWVWCRLGEIIEFISGNNFNSTDFKKGEGIKCIKITNAGVGEIIETYDVLPKSFLETFSSFLVFEGDLILALTRPYIADGLKVSKCPKSYNFSLLNQRVAVLRPSLNVSKEFIYNFLRSNFVLNIYKEMFSGKGQQPNLKKEHVTELLFPLPPLAEQQRIVTKLEQLMQLCSELEKNINQSKEETNLLLQTVLREALEEKEN